jgi:hypothetical protein
MTLTRASADPYGVVSAPFTVASNTTGRLFFDHAGADSFGILLDRADIVGVRTSVVPVPAALPLLASALGLLTAVPPAPRLTRRRRIS